MTAEARGYLAGLIDGEGHVDVAAHRVVITNTDREIIDAALRAAVLLGFPTREREKPYEVRGERRIAWEVALVGRDSCRRLLDFPIAAPRKRMKIEYAALPRREQFCKGCGCVLDKETEGCRQCRSRHYRRVYLAEGIRRGHASGERHPLARLSADDVGEIRRRRAEGESCEVVALDYGVSKQHVSRITRGTRWAVDE